MLIPECCRVSRTAPDLGACCVLSALCLLRSLPREAPVGGLSDDGEEVRVLLGVNNTALMDLAFSLGPSGLQKLDGDLQRRVKGFNRRHLPVPLQWSPRTACHWAEEVTDRLWCIVQ